MIVKQLGMVEYLPTLQAMEAFTVQRTLHSEDQLWLCEHPAVFTLGQGAKPEHILSPGTIPIVHTARGGQVTYHGPGQLIAYPLIHLKHQGIFIKEYVHRLEQAAINTLQHFGIAAERIPGAPGVYVRTSSADSSAAASSPPPTGPSFNGMAKIAALGIKVSRSCTYHGLALNVAMDLEPYSRINPCGYPDLITTDMHTMGAHATVAEVAAVLSALLSQQFAKPIL